MADRKISKVLAAEILRHPEQVTEEFGGRKGYQSRIEFETGKTYLVRLVVEEQDDAGEIVITAYRTRKIAKYWKREP